MIMSIFWIILKLSRLFGSTIYTNFLLLRKCECIIQLNMYIYIYTPIDKFYLFMNFKIVCSPRESVGNLFESFAWVLETSYYISTIVI